LAEIRSFISEITVKGYDRDKGKVFMDRVYSPYMMKNEEPVPFLSHKEKKEEDYMSNSLLS
jgi:hypothetical protein